MVKGAIQRRRRYFFPARRAVTGLARLRKATPVGISVAIATLVKGYPDVARLFVRPWNVALLAGDLGMQAGKRIACQ